MDMVNRVILNELKLELSQETLHASTQNKNSTKPSSAWYLVPLFLALLGGLLGYIALKDEDKKMADTLLYIGIFMTILGIVYFLIL